MADGRWIEVVVGAARRDHDRVLRSGFAPVLHGEGRPAGLRRGYFLRDAAAVPERLRLRAEVVGVAEAGAVRDAVMAALRRACADELVLTVELDDAPPRAELDGLWSGVAAPGLRDDFFAETSALLFDVLDAIAGDAAARLAIAFDLMVVHADETSRLLFRHTSYPDTFFSYRSHADGFFVMSKQPEVTRQVFEQRYQRSASALRTRLQQILGADPEPAGRWRAVVAAYVPRVLDLVDAGTLAPATGGREYLGDGFDLSVSPFHQVIQGDGEYRRFMQTDLRFATMRILLTCLYWTLQHLGVRLIDRYVLCHSVSRAFEEVFAVDPAAALAAARAATPAATEDVDVG